MALRRSISDITVRMHILDFMGTRQAVLPLPRGHSMCTSLENKCGTSLCCRCSRCKAPLGYQEDRVLRKLARKVGRGHAYMIFRIAYQCVFLLTIILTGRAVAARWLHLLAGLVARFPEDGALHGLLLAAGCARGAEVSFLRDCLPELVDNAVANWVWTWVAALFVQYVSDRAPLRAKLGTAFSEVLRISLN